MHFKLQSFTGYIQLAVGGFIVSQWTRTDAILPSIDLSADESSDTKTTLADSLFGLILDRLSSFQERVIKLSLSYSNLSYLILLLLIPIVIYLVEKRTIVSYSLAISIVSVIIVTCTSPKKKEFPFAALMATGGITSDTPSIGDNGSSSGNGQTTSTGQTGNNGQTNGTTTTNNGQTGSHPQPSGNTQIGGGGASSAGTPVSGIYFYHTNQINSVTMITDGKGEMVSGMDLATGKSVIRYKPYGEIDRTNSDGPDIFRYKYTGQEEDRETGLYYYKARYYDPVLGRFLQADTVLDSEKSFGMNQYMYVGGDPISRKDPSGHSWLSAGKISGFNKFNKWWKGQMKFKDIKSISMNRLQISPRRQAGILTPSSKNPCDDSYNTSDAGPCFAIINAITPFTSKPGHSGPVDPLEPPDWGDDGVPLHTDPRNCTPVDEEEYLCRGLWYENNPRDLPPFIEPDPDDEEYINLTTLDPIPNSQDIYFVLHRDDVFSYGIGTIYWERYDTLDDGILARYFDPRAYPNDICQIKVKSTCTGIAQEIDTVFFKFNAVNVPVIVDNYGGFGYKLYNYYADKNGYISSYGRREPVELDPTSRRVDIQY